MHRLQQKLKKIVFTYSTETGHFHIKSMPKCSKFGRFNCRAASYAVYCCSGLWQPDTTENRDTHVMEEEEEAALLHFRIDAAHRGPHVVVSSDRLTVSASSTDQWALSEQGVPPGCGLVRWAVMLSDGDKHSPRCG